MAPVPPRDVWVAENDARPLNRALGIRADDIGRGYAQFRVEPVPATGDHASVLPFAAVTAADLCVMNSVTTTLERGREEMNGTAELNLTYLEQRTAGVLTVRGELIERGSHVAVVDLVVREASGRAVARGRSSYAVRPVRARR